ncbi:MAG TPA: MOSC domain-containing protein [Sediminispirochaeta sp.]|nr:MOSC domain-containing protein [Sediminispirochaeta sp.]
MNIRIGSLNISERKGVVKNPIDRVEVDLSGIPADAHSGRWHRQISLLGRPSISRFEEQMKRRIGPGEFGENITVEGIDLNEVGILDRFRIGEVEMEITQIGKTCHGDDCAIFREVGKCVMPQEGLFARVIRGGELQKGQEMEYIPYPFRIEIITASDRAAAGEYQDRSGPRAEELCRAHFGTKRWHMESEIQVVPDEAEALRGALGKAQERGADIIITTGGTGVGPRDITVDVVRAMADKLIPGIMDHIRLKYGENKPNALISRSICAMVGSTIVYTLPGSVKAVEEYLREIFRSVDHLITMVHGIGH